MHKARTISVSGIILILLLLLVEGGFAGPAGDPMALMPPTTLVAVAVSSSDKLITASRFAQKNMLSDIQADRITRWAEEFKKRTRVDVFDVSSLRKQGINTNKTIYLALIKKTGVSKHMLLFIPVKHAKSFPLRFVGLLKKNYRGDKSIDLNPVTTRYRKYVCHQVLKDIFFTSIDDYFIVTQSEQIMKQVIDIKLGKGSVASLKDDRLYQDYLARVPGKGDVVLFVRGGFFLSSGDTKGGEDDAGSGKGFSGASTFLDEMRDRETVISAIRKKSADLLGALQYLGMCIDVRKDKLFVDTQLSYIEDAPIGQLLQKLFQTSVKIEEKTILYESPALYFYSRLNLQDAAKWCREHDKKYTGSCRYYGKLERLLKDRTGIELDEEMASGFKGAINVISRKNENLALMDDLVLYVYLKNDEMAANVWKRIRKHMKEKDLADYGDEKIKGVTFFRYKDKKNNTYYLAQKGSGLFFGNNREFINKIVESRSEAPDQAEKRFFGEDAVKDPFLLFYARLNEQRFLKTVIALMVYNKSLILYSLIDRVDTLQFSASLEKNRVLMKLKVEVKE